MQKLWALPRKLIRRFSGWQISLGITLATIVISLTVTRLSFTWLSDGKNVEIAMAFAVIVPAVLVPLFSYGFLHVMKELDTSEMEKASLVSELSESLENAKVLRGLLPICAECKKIRDDKGYWHQVEEYMAQHTEAGFSHGLCPDCANQAYRDYQKKANGKSE